MPSIVILLLQYAIPILLPFLLFLFSLHKHQLSSSQGNKKSLPPSPPRLPIIGHLQHLGRMPHRNLRSLSQKYGDLILLHLGSKPTLIGSSAEAASQVMKTHDLAFCSKPELRITRILSNGKGVGSSPYGEYWRRMRSICVLEVLSTRKVQSFCSIREEEVAHMVESIKRMASSLTTPSAVINMREVFVSLATDVISRVVSGRKHKGEGFEELLKETMELMGKIAIGDFLPWLAWIDRVTGVAERVDKAIKTFDNILERILAEHFKNRRRGKDDGDGEEKSATKDYVDVLLEIEKGGDLAGHMSIDRDSVKALMLDMFAAGTETTFTTLEWTMSEILRSPRVTEELQEEVRKAAKGKEVITEDDLKAMVYLKAVIKETLRLHPWAPFLFPRVAMQDEQINGYDIAAGTLLLTNAWAIARDPKYWEEPELFCPERFLNSSTDFKGNDFKMLPFGAGRRGCPGESFGLAIVELAIANLLLQFNWKLPVGIERETFDMTEQSGLTLKKTIPLLARATPRVVQKPV